jgi:hypothetical protein
MKKRESEKYYDFKKHKQNLAWQPVNSVRTARPVKIKEIVPSKRRKSLNRWHSVTSQKTWILNQKALLRIMQSDVSGEQSINFRILGTISDDSLMRPVSATSTNLDCLQWKRNVRKWRQRGKRHVDSVASGEKVVNSALEVCASSSRVSVLQWHLSTESKGTFIGWTGLHL